MTDIAAALGIEQLRKADRFRNRRAQIAEIYSQAFGGVDGIQVPAVQPQAGHAWHLYIILLDLDVLRINRAEFIKELKQRNIGTSVHFIPLHLHPYYRDALGWRRGDFPNAEWVYDRCISLPIYPAMNDGDVADVVEAVKDIFQRSKR